jgi:hypothetical protein
LLLSCFSLIASTAPLFRSDLLSLIQAQQ